MGVEVNVGGIFVFVEVGSGIIVGENVGIAAVAVEVGVDAFVGAGVQEAARRMKSCVSTTMQPLMNRRDCFVAAHRATPRNDTLHPSALFHYLADFFFQRVCFLFLFGEFAQIFIASGFIGQGMDVDAHVVGGGGERGA